MNKKRLLLGFLIVMTFSLVAAGRPQTATAVAPQAPVQIAAVQTNGALVNAEGSVVPLFDANLSFQMGGQVAEILVSEGDQVKIGDALVRLDTTEAELALQQAQARLASAQAAVTLAQNQQALAEAAIQTAESQVAAAQANLALVKAGPRPEEIAAAESKLAAAQAAVNQAAGQRDTALDVVTDSQISSAQAQVAAAAAEVRALEDSYDTILTTCFDTPDGEVCPLYGAVEETTRAQLEAARQNQAAAQAALDALQAGPTNAQQQAAQGGVDIAIANRDLAQAQLDLLQEPASAEEVAVAEVGVLQAQVGVDSAKAGVTQAEAAVAQAEAGVVQAEAGVAAAQAALDRMTLRATFDGTVSRINTNVGELVAPSVPVVTMADFSGWQVKTTDLTELDVAFVNAGDAATVSFDAIPGETVSGTVTAVSLVADLARGDVVYEVTIDLDAAPDLPLRWGMTAVVDIES
ncbi:MAG: efflux RND transporter periplasmic adaptor subunit [Anaerolineales bacterium]|nr:efflux RND transporter periplasmic adaptor subunit [Anaerolineales bacterium]